jgi:hypothetical protein
MSINSEICPICRDNPTSHSFSRISEENGIAIFYTAPAKATNLETAGIITHYDLILEQVSQPWILVFDYKDYSLLQQMSDIQTGIELSKLLNDKYSSNLQQIIIIHSNIFVKTVIHIISFFITNEMFQKIYISDESYHL